MKKLLILFLSLWSSVASAQDRIVPVIEIPYFDSGNANKPGWEERSDDFNKWLAPSVMVTAYGGGGGSGTICHYDGEYAYIISCGHLYAGGRKSWVDLQKNPIYKKITVFYHNDKKLNPPREYKGETLCYVHNLRSSVFDVSLIRFKPDWDSPWVAPIAPEDYKLEVNKYYHSCGCDGLRPVAHYLVRYLFENKVGDITEIVTTDNNPRGGRSGGGVMTEDGELLFICSRGGGGRGYWSSLNQIHKFLKEEKFEFVLASSSPARMIPIVGNENKKYPKDFIPVPNGR